MGGRITLQVGLIVVGTIVLSWVGLGLLLLIDSAEPLEALVDDAPRTLFGLMGIALALWAVMVLIGAVAHRHRAVGWRIGTHLVSLVVAIGVNLVVLFVIALGQVGGGGWEFLLLAIGVGAGAVLLIAGTIAVLVVELVVVRPRRVERGAPLVDG